MKIWEYAVNPASPVPAYRQLARLIHGDIKRGILAAGARLPTVRQLAESTGLARGTIKHAYDELEASGVIEMTRGRGSFVKNLSESDQSRKDRAMRAIDGLLDRLETLDFTPEQISIFFDLKLRERAAEKAGVRVAFVEEDPETLRQVTEGLKGQGGWLEGLRIYPWLLRDALANPYKLGEEMELILVTAGHLAELRAAVPEKEKLLPVALTLTEASLRQLAGLWSGRLAPGPTEHKETLPDPKPAADGPWTAGILSASPEFGARLSQSLGKIAPGLALEPAALLSDREALEKWLASRAAVLLPQGYEAFCRRDVLSALEAAGRKGPLVQLGYFLDQGSLLSLAERLAELSGPRGGGSETGPLSKAL